MNHFVLITFACIFIAFLVFVLKETGYLKVAAKSGALCVLFLLVTSFIFGLFNRFSFMHGAAEAGLESAIAYMVLLGVIIGPFLFVIGGLCGAAISCFRKRGKGKSKE
ncbi:hypothetical protein GCM10011613_36810 [Cellvibrio zantedeschiae]|uniref:Inner membrane protein n=1 Tax=Cellvibrio zantedeschiae TaxID=1237077 RepID=A0ABQ3BB06_9GAMM|nr:hypothetical protein [Cellvibrio zantedeschiae]GGY88401.1 hypothetical protein GCM10011613_36810 [Cellvibrio zantedeschiae]